MTTAAKSSIPQHAVIRLTDFDALQAAGVAVRGDFDDVARTAFPGKWVLIDNVWGASTGQLLVATEASAPPLVFRAGVRGRHQIRLRFFGQAPNEEHAVYMRLGGEPCFTRLHSDRTQQEFQEVLFKAADLEPDSTIEVACFGARACLDAVHLVPAPPAAPAPPPARRVIGICDFVVNLASHKPAGMEAAACVQQHKDAGFNLVLWKVYKVVCEYHTNVGVRRDMGVAYDTLRQAVDHAKAIGLDLYGWVRINNEFSRDKPMFSGTPFHAAHPDQRIVNKQGVVRPRLSFAYPEVRQHKIDIIREVAAYGVAGICIDVLRQPPMAEYDLPLVEAFMRQTGQDPRKIAGDGPEAWLRFRATAFTQFLRETRAALTRDRGQDFPLIVRTVDQPWRNLLIGCDIQAWLDEGLVDGIIFAAHLPSPAFHPESLDLTPHIQMARGRAPVYGQVWTCGSMTQAEVLAAQVYAQGAAGVAFYETEQGVQRPRMWENLPRFADPAKVRGLAPVPAR